MKKVFKTALIVAASIMISTSSCKKADEATPLENATSSATIKGVLLYDKNTVNDRDINGNTINSNVDTDPAAGAKIKVTTYSDITGDNGNAITKIVTVNADGSYEFSVPATSDGAYVEVEVLDFESTFTFKYSDNGTSKETTERGYFAGFGIDDYTVYPGETKLLGKEYFGNFNTTTNPSNY